jgi:uncharacterized protein (DUF1330 family)
VVSCYFVAQITINDPEAYRRYEHDFDEVFAGFGGRVVAVDDQPEVLEGRWPHRRAVLIRFASGAEARRWYHSPEYQALARVRREAADSVVMLVEGRDDG